MDPTIFSFMYATAVRVTNPADGALRSSDATSRVHCRLQQDEAAVLDTADAKDPKVTDSRAALMTARQQQQRPRQHGLRASQLCCTAAKLFIALRCNCWQGLDPRTLEYLADQAAMCGPLPSAVEAVNPADSLVKVRKRICDTCFMGM